MTPLVPLFAAIVPFVLWPIELILPYPYIIEEIAKALLIMFLLQEKRVSRIILTVLIGLLFAFSENVLYLFNILLVGDIKTLLVRFLLTTPLHISTSLVILFFASLNKKLIVLGIVAASVLHFFFNFFLF